MKSRNLFLCFVMLLAVAFYGCQAANDAKLTTEVKTKITQDDQLDHSDISVDTKNGVVTLTGKVENSSQIAEATQVAKTVEGVQDVVANLTVEESAATADNTPSDHGTTDAGQTFDDASTTAKVKLALTKDDTVDAIKINVDTLNGVVTLTGTVKNDNEAQRAVELAKGVEGVKDVNSNLKIGS